MKFIFNHILAPGGACCPAGPSRRLNLDRQCGSAALDVVLNILDRNKNR